MRHSSIKAKGDRTAQILIYEEIGDSFFGGLGAKAFVEQLDALTEIDTLTIRINSDGGDVFQGVAIYNALNAHPAKKNVVIDGLAASIATVIAMAGDTISIQPSAMMMIHNARGTFRGDHRGIRQAADLLETINGQMAVAYSRTGKTPAEILQVMDAETWFTAQQAVDAGWANAIVAQPLKLAASLKGFDLTSLGQVPAWVKARAESSPEQGCSCPCTPCLDGNCADCEDAPCDCEGCDCVSPDATKAAKTAQEAAESQDIQQKALISARVRARSLDLAAYS